MPTENCDTVVGMSCKNAKNAEKSEPTERVKKREKMIDKM